MVGPVAGDPRPGSVGAAYYYGVDRDQDHCFANWGGSLLPVRARRVGEAGAWTGGEILVAHQVQVDTDQARAGVVGTQEAVVHLVVAVVEAALYVGGLARARIQTSAA